jgi:hypothetical protein
VRAFFIGLLVEVGVDPVPPAAAPSVFADAVAAIAGAAVAAASRWPGIGGAPVVAETFIRAGERHEVRRPQVRGFVALVRPGTATAW